MRQRLLFPFLLACVPLAARAQRTEWTAQLNGGLSCFGGKSAQHSGGISYGGTPATSYTYGGVGRLPGLSYGAALQGQRLTRGGWVFGAQAGYEWLRSRIRVGTVLLRHTDYGVFTTGHTTFTNQFVNGHLLAGRRLQAGPLALDLTLGPEVGVLTGSREKGRATDDQGQVYRSDRALSGPTLDARARLNLTAFYQHWGLSASYSHGLSNYRRGWVGGVNEAYSRTARLGVVYRL